MDVFGINWLKVGSNHSTCKINDALNSACWLKCFYQSTTSKLMVLNSTYDIIMIWNNPIRR